MAKGIKPIIGCEVYTARRTRFDREPGIDADQGHLVLLAKDNTGYKNLMKIVSAAFTEGFYYKPRADYELLEMYSEGLIALSACMSGDVSRYILENNYNKALETAIRLNDIFGKDNFSWSCRCMASGAKPCQPAAAENQQGNRHTSCSYE